MPTLELDGRSLTLEQVEAVAGGLASGRANAPTDAPTDVSSPAPADSSPPDPGAAWTVTLHPRAVARMNDSRRLVVEKVDSGQVVYGVTTGFGRLAEVAIAKEDQMALQRNLLRSHAAGTGPLLPPDAVRVMLLLRANALARGLSGIRPLVVERLLAFLNRGLLPAIPAMGSVGASGDLAPLAHMALPLMGEGAFLDTPPRGRSDRSDWSDRGPRRDGSETFGSGTVEAAPVLEAEGLEPLVLEAKEGLALINGTQATTGLGILAFLRARRALEALEVAGALSLEALLGTPEAFRPEVQEARPHPGQAESARRLRDLLAGSSIRESHRHGDHRVQDAYSLRCMPQVHGAGRDVLAYVEGVLVREANAATDNPLIFTEAGGGGVVVSAGNFHAQVVSQALDFLCIAVADLASISERRLERLLNPDLSGLPPFLAPRPGLDSGYMILQVTVVDLLGELRVLAHPASVDSVPTSASQEDHVSMGMAAARKALRSVDLLERVVAAELLAAAQGLEFRRPLRSGSRREAAPAPLRRRVRPLDGDRPPAPDLAAVLDLVRSGAVGEV
jgi:histidine ammonia-lyase